MKTIICGMRNATMKQTMLAIESAINKGAVITQVVSGGAPGADTYGEQWAAKVGLTVMRFPADWDKHGRAAFTSCARRTRDRATPARH